MWQCDEEKLESSTVHLPFQPASPSPSGSGSRQGRRVWAPGFFLETRRDAQKPGSMSFLKLYSAPNQPGTSIPSHPSRSVAQQTYIIITFRFTIPSPTTLGFHKGGKSHSSLQHPALLASVSPPRDLPPSSSYHPRPR